MGKLTSKKEKKEYYDKRVCVMLEEYTQALICVADNVGSKQFQDIRSGLRPESVVLMGKNTLLKRTIRQYVEKTGATQWLAMLPLLVGNVGLVFTKGDLKEVAEQIAKYRVGAPARVGLVAPTDVVVPPGNTGLDPSQTSFFQVLNIPTKINKGTVEIVTAVDLIKTGEKVGSSEAALLAKLNIRPFSYGLIVIQVYNEGSSYDPSVLNMTDDDLVGKFQSGLATITAVSLGAGYPTILSLPHTFVNCYKNVVAVALGLEDYSFPAADKIKAILADPSAFAAASAPAEVATEAAPAAAAPKEAVKAEEPEEESDGEMGFSLFDD